MPVILSIVLLVFDGVRRRIGLVKGCGVRIDKFEDKGIISDMFLDKSIFSTVIASTPLVSIDLVITNAQGQALLGERLNRPARGFWFVPGGRILKNECLANAFERLTREELGQSFSIEQARLLGPFDHFYVDNVFTDETQRLPGENVGTHYVALAYALVLDVELECLPVAIQHERYRWFDMDKLKIDAMVHKHTKRYFFQ